MSKDGPVEIWLRTEEKTQELASKLLDGLYGRPVTLFLDGDLGAGKTTFVRAIARHLGVPGPITSPTYAIEQRYAGSNGSLIHLDLYRIEGNEAAMLLSGSDDQADVRCIEWSQRLPEGVVESQERSIQLHFREGQTPDSRIVDIRFRDIPLPSIETIQEWQRAVLLPENIIRHCNAVAQMAADIADALNKAGTPVRRHAVWCAGQCHDLLRFLDFRPSAAPPGAITTDEQEEVWGHQRTLFPGLSHEAAAAEFLRDRGFWALGDIVRTHGLVETHERHTIEQHILYYADKRVINDKRVTVKQRFDDFATRYANGSPTPLQLGWMRDVLTCEKMLFPDGAPL